MFYSSRRLFLVTYSNAHDAILGCGCARPRHCNRSPVSTAHLQPGRRWRQAAVGIGGVETKKWEIPLFPLPHHSEKELKSGISVFPLVSREIPNTAPTSPPHRTPRPAPGVPRGLPRAPGPLGPLCFMFFVFCARSQGPTARAAYLPRNQKHSARHRSKC